MPRSAALALCLAALLAPVSGVAAQAQSGPIRPADLMRHISVLAHDSMEGRLMGSPGGAKARAYLVRVLADAGLQPLGASFERPFSSTSARDTTVRRGVNLVGVIRGTTNPDRYIVVTAHYDHVGVRQGQVYNGADDNASGAGALVELVRQFRAAPPANSMLFVEFDGEEGGLRGARAFVAEPPVPAASIVMNVNLDMVSRNEKNELYAAGTAFYPFLKPYLDTAVTRSTIHLRLGHDDANGPRGDNWTSQSDQGAFHAAHIPFIYFGVEDHPDYHKPTDDVERVMPEFYAGAINTVLDALRMFDANLGTIAAKAGPRG